jgi:hypothetical protein
MLMKLPAHFYGLYQEVKRRNAKIITQLCKGADWMALIEAGGFLEVETTPGYVVVDGPSPLTGGQPHFQIWPLWFQIWEKTISFEGKPRVSKELAEEVFERSLTRPWSTLGLVAYRGQQWLRDKHRYRPFLDAVRQYWSLFDSIGARYSDGLQRGYTLWFAGNSIKYVLANLGVPTEVLRSPLPAGGLEELIDRAEQRWN